MEFSVKLEAERIAYFSEDYWCFYDEPIPPAMKLRLKLALTELVSGFNTDTPVMLTHLAAGAGNLRQGKFAKDVYWVDPHRFRFGEFIVVNTSFLTKCLAKYNFVESFGLIGKLVEDESALSETLHEWDQMVGLHCFVIDLREDADV